MAKRKEPREAIVREKREREIRIGIGNNLRIEEERMRWL